MSDVLRRIWIRVCHSNKILFLIPVRIDFKNAKLFPPTTPFLIDDIENLHTMMIPKIISNIIAS